MQRLRRLMVVSSTVITAVITALLALAATAATASPVPLTARTGQAGSPAAGGSNDFFNGDSCASSTFCMAVGGFSLNGHSPGLSELLSHGRWIAKRVPSPAHGINMFANEVSCASPASCLFVGDHFAGQRGPIANLAEAWNGSSAYTWNNGTTWRRIGVPHPRRARSSELGRRGVERPPLGAANHG